jgi:hypothetical protein
MSRDWLAMTQDEWAVEFERIARETDVVIGRFPGRAKITAVSSVPKGEGLPNNWWFCRNMGLECENVTHERFHELCLAEVVNGDK